MSSTKKNKWFIGISLVSALCGVLMQLLRNTSIADYEVIRQILGVAPNFFYAITVPFFILFIIRLIIETHHELRIFYYVIFGTLLIMIGYEYLMSIYGEAIYSIYDVIASCIGFFVNMVIYYQFEKKDLRKYKVE